eukprot:snap_masked-scaffold_44-processed-gene-1.10-mRNA-1 protein AED:0.29 eAED:1.00 QI:0/0/0/1/1/1/2/0/209
MSTPMLLFGFDLFKLLNPLQLFPLFFDEKTAGSLFYTFCFFQGLNILQVGFFTYFALNGIIRDMKILGEDLSPEQKKVNKFYLYCTEAIPNIKKMIRITLGFTVCFGLSALLYCVSYRFEFFMSYVFALSGFGFSLMSSVIGYSFTRNTLIGKKLRQSSTAGVKTSFTGNIDNSSVVRRASSSVRTEKKGSFQVTQSEVQLHLQKDISV